MYFQLQTRLSCWEGQPEANDSNPNGQIFLQGTWAAPISWLMATSSQWYKSFPLKTQNVEVCMHTTTWWVMKNVSMKFLDKQGYMTGFIIKKVQAFPKYLPAKLSQTESLVYCMRKFMLQVHTFLCEDLRRLFFSLHSLLLITRTLEKSNVFETFILY